MSNEPDKVNSGALATVVVLLALAMLGVSLTVTALVRAETAEISEDRLAPAQNGFRNLRAEQQAELNAPPSWSDRAKGLVSLPIERAQKLMLGDIKRGRTWVGELKVEEQNLGGAPGTEAAEDAAASQDSAEPATPAAPGLTGTGDAPGTPGPAAAPLPKAPEKAPEAPKAPAPEAPKAPAPAPSL